MRKLTCLHCELQIAESDKVWDIASQYSKCPNCKNVLSYFENPENKILRNKADSISYSPRRVFVTFALIGPLIGVSPFLVMGAGAQDVVFIVLLFSYLVGIIPASIAGLMFNSIMHKFDQQFRNQEILLGMVSGLIGVLPILIFSFGEINSLLLTIIFVLWE